MGTFLQVVLRSLETGGVYALAALGIIIIFRTSNITQFAQGSMGMFNTFVAATLVNKLQLPQDHHRGRHHSVRRLQR